MRASTIRTMWQSTRTAHLSTLWKSIHSVSGSWVLVSMDLDTNNPLPHSHRSWHPFGELWDGDDDKLWLTLFFNTWQNNITLTCCTHLFDCSHPPLVKNFSVESGGNELFRHEMPKVMPQILMRLKYTSFPWWILMFSGLSTVGEKNALKCFTLRCVSPYSSYPIVKHRWFQRWKHFTLGHVLSYFLALKTSGSSAFAIT